MTGIITFDMNEANGCELNPDALEKLREKLEGIAEDFYQIISVDNKDFDYDKAEELQDEYDEIEEFEVECTNAEFFLAENGYSLSIHR